MGTWAPPSALGNLMAQVRLLTQRKVTNGEIMHLFSLQTKAEVGQAWASEGAAHRVISCRLWKGWFRWTCAREQAAAWQQLQVPLSLTHTRHTDSTRSKTTSQRHFTALTTLDGAFYENSSMHRPPFSPPLQAGGPQRPKLRKAALTMRH